VARVSECIVKAMDLPFPNSSSPSLDIEPKLVSHALFDFTLDKHGGEVQKPNSYRRLGHATEVFGR
jgi:hypothetical protein